MNTARPEGIWMALHADYILLTACPPGPLERVNWYLMSLGSTQKEKGTTGMTTSEIVLEWSLPFDSVSGTRITLCTPDSHFSTLWQPSPCTRISKTLQPLDTPVYFTALLIQHFQPWLPQNDSYIELISSTKIELSAPPAPGLNSKMTSSALSQGAGGTMSSRDSSWQSMSLSLLAAISWLRISFSAWSLVSLIISCRSVMFWRVALICSLSDKRGASLASYILICYLLILLLKEGVSSFIDFYRSAAQSAFSCKAPRTSQNVCSESRRGSPLLLNWQKLIDVNRIPATTGAKQVVR